MNFSNDDFYEAKLKFLDREVDRLHKWVICLILLTSLSISSMITMYDYYQPQITGLQSQLRRTQYQLRKAREQNQEQTKRIAELTGNGG